MEHTSRLEKAIRGVLVALILVFFLFPILWIFLMSLQTNEDILRIPPSPFFTVTPPRRCLMNPTFIVHTWAVPRRAVRRTLERRRFTR